jgi:nucleoside-diphosphate-sugar epimerase
MPTSNTQTQEESPLVVITGGAGLIGSHLTRRLLPDYRVVSLDFKCDPMSPPSVDMICTDLTLDESVSRAVDRIEMIHGTEVASLIHLAAYYDFSGADSPLYEEVTIRGTERLLTEMQRLHLDQVVFSSKYVKGGDEVGHDSVVCTITSLKRQEAQCVATAWFPGGQITAQALISFAEEPPAVPITGGSGKYTGAEGEIHVRTVSDTKEILTFRLED